MMEDARELTGRKSDPEYTGEGFRRDAQNEEVKIPELVRSGDGFRVDQLAMEKKVNDELEKILNEQLLPFKALIKESLKPLAALLLTIGNGLLAKWCLKSGSLFFDGLYPALSIIAFCVVTIIFIFMACDEGIFLPSAIYKLYRAKKLFRQIAENLHSDAMDGKIELTSFREKFSKKVETIRNQIWQKKLDQKQEHNRLLNEAKNFKF